MIKASLFNDDSVIDFPEYRDGDRLSELENLIISSMGGSKIRTVGNPLEQITEFSAAGKIYIIRWDGFLSDMIESNLSNISIEFHALIESGAITKV